MSRVRIARLAMGDGAVPRPTFDLGAEIHELGTVDGRLNVRYTITIDTFPSVERAEVEGVATITGDRFTTAKDLQGIEEGRITKVAIAIYRNDFETLYLLLKSMGLEAPSPWLVKDVHIVATPSDGREGAEAAPAQTPEVASVAMPGVVPPIKKEAPSQGR